MTEPSASISVAVVPDASGFWREFTARTSGEATQAGREAGRRVRDGMDEELARGVNVNVHADTGAARAEIDSLGKSSANAQKQSHLLADAIVALGPAAVPVAAVAVGAIAGLIPVAATAVLGIKGISQELKSGQLAGTQYGADITKLKNELQTLESISAAGLLNGLNQAMKGSGPLFAQVNGDVAQFAGQLGNIAGNAAPALLSLLHDLAPLFTTIGHELEVGAARFKAWAQSSGSISKFVSYVQSELPQVIHTVGSLIETVVHLAAGLAPAGHVALDVIEGISTAINAIPIDVLSKLETVAIATYGAFRTYQIITGIVNSVSTALETFQARNAGAAAAVTAASLATEAAAAGEAAAVADAAATEAAARATAAAEIAAATSATNSVLAEGAAAAAASAAEFAAAQQAEAEAAQAAAAEIAAAAASAAAAAEAEGAAAGIGFAGMLGPIGAVVAGVTILGSILLTSSGDAKAASSAMQDYADSVKKSTNALAEVNVQQTYDNLSKAGALVALNALHSANMDLGVSYGDLATAVNGSEKQFNSLFDTLKAEFQSDAVQNGPAKQRDALYSVLTALDDNRAGLFAQIKVQKAYEASQRNAQAAIDGTSGAAARQAAALGVTKNAYLDAQIAAQKNTQKTQQQTIAMQLASDAAGLLQAALDKLSGKKVNYADSLNQFQQGLVSLQKQIKSTNGSIKGLTEGAIGNRAALIGEVKQAEQTAGAYGDLKKSSEAGRQKLVQLRQQIIDNAVAQGANRKAVTDYIDSLLKIPKSVPPTKAQVDAKEAQAQVKDLQAKINAIKQGKVPGVDADTKAGEGLIKALQADIDRLTQHHKPIVDAYTDTAMSKLATLQNYINGLHGKSVYIDETTIVSRRSGGNSGAHAMAIGGVVHGPGTETSDSVPIWASDEEFVVNAKQSKKHRKLLEAINNGIAGYANGGVVILDPTKGSSSSSGGSSSSSSSSSSGSSGSHSSASLNYRVDGSTTSYASLRSAENAARSILKANLKLDVQIDTKGFRALDKALQGSVSSARAAFATIRDEARKLGASKEFLDTFKAPEKALLGLVRERNIDQGELTKALTKLHNLVSAQKQEASSIRQATNASFDITGAGVQANGKVAGGAIVAQDKQAAVKAKQFFQTIQDLGKRHLNGTYLRELALKGPDALAEAEAVDHLSKAGLASLNASQAATDKYAQKLGQYISGRDYNGRIAGARDSVQDLRTDIHRDNVKIENRLHHMEDRLADKLDKLAERPVNIYLDGKRVGRVLDESRNRANR